MHLLFFVLAATTFRISGHVKGASDKADVIVALWNAEGFLKSPVQRIRIAPGQAKEFNFDVDEGKWCISAFEDKNGNDKLDMGLFGPKEPSGFWRRFTAWRKPRFDDVETYVAKDIGDADIKL